MVAQLNTLISQDRPFACMVKMVANKFHMFPSLFFDGVVNDKYSVFQRRFAVNRYDPYGKAEYECPPVEPFVVEEPVIGIFPCIDLPDDDGVGPQRGYAFHQKGQKDKPIEKDGSCISSLLHYC